LPTAAVVVLLCAALCGGCDKEPVAPPAGQPHLVELGTVDLACVTEPSGLALDTDGTYLWTVSDQAGSIHRLAPDGTCVTVLDIGGEDLEGVAVDPGDGTLFVVEESLGQVLRLDREGNLLSRWTPAGLPEMGNSGLEGITIDPASGHVFLLKEKDPGLLVELDDQGAVVAVHDLDFAADYSGLAFDPASGLLLVISDQSATLTWCTTGGMPVRTLATGLDKGEGIALSADGTVLYAVSDSRSTLSSFRIDE